MEDLDFILFDKFRHMGHMMRAGCTPGELSGSGAAGADQADRTGRDPFFRVHHRDIILGVLDINGGSLRPKEIAGEIHVSASTLSEMIRRLEEEGFVERRQDPADRRAVILALTETGRTRADAIRESQARIVRHLFRNLTEAEKQEMIRLFDVILRQQ